MAQIYSITIQPLDRNYGEGREDYLRFPVAEAVLVAGHGIQGDQKAGHHPQRQLNLLSREWLAEMQARGYRSDPGQFGEQLILDGLDLDTVQPGDRLHLGAVAVIEITRPRHGCDRLQLAQRGLPTLVDEVGPIGLLARVIQGGVIRVGDETYLADPVPAAKSASSG